MKRLKFKNRIAYFNTLAVAITTAVVFVVIYFVVERTSYNHLDDDIVLEKEEIFSNLDVFRDSIVINKIPEWYEAEHNKVEVNPTFIQLVNNRNEVVFHSSNLLNDFVLISSNVKHKIYFNSEINNQKIRLGQFPIRNNKKEIIGQLAVAVSSQESSVILNSLLLVLIVAFPFVLIIQFLASSVAAARAIRPVNQLIASTSVISDSNIETRLALPERKDELYELTVTINDLLSRIDESMLLQKQFTSDASHEIRTPLAAIRGTLEVLIRKTRAPEYYATKIASVIVEVDRLNRIIEQLLQLARIESGGVLVKREKLSLFEIIASKVAQWRISASTNAIDVVVKVPQNVLVLVDRVLLELVLDNLMSNAIKYGKLHGSILLEWSEEQNSLAIIDDGIGMSTDQLSKIFKRFYRIDASRSSAIKGIGLGLSIAQKMCDIQNVKISVKSTVNEGSNFSLVFS